MFGLALFGLCLSSISFADIITDLRAALDQKNPAAADSQLQTYRSQHGVDPEYLEALSWTARAALARKDYKQAYAAARQNQLLSGQMISKRSLGAEPHLPLALGAAYEVESQVLAARGEHAQAVLLLRSALHSYANTSIVPRLQKNLNLLTVVGKPPPPLNFAEHFGPDPVPLAQLKGSPVLLFFWAHWCVDCKGEAPIITQLRSEFSSKGLTLLAPTQRY